MKINFETVRFIGMLYDLSERTRHGFVDFAKCTGADIEDAIVFDTQKTDEYGRAFVVMDAQVDELHHDVVSYWSEYCGAKGEYNVVADISDSDLPYLVVQTADGIYQFAIVDGHWYPC